MARFDWLKDLAQRLGELRIAAKRDSGINCADCPIVMRCGLEPQQRCLGKLEAMAAGRKRQVGPWDTGRIEIGM